MLFAIVDVPDEAAANPIPTAENVPLLTTLPITLLVIVALVTSFPVVVVAENPLCRNPALIPTTSGELVWDIPEILFPEIVMPSSNPTSIPPTPTLFGEAVLIRLLLITVPLFLLAALAPVE